jgi:hypothetical protein
MYNPYGPKPKPRAVEPDAVVGFAQDDHPALSRNLLRDLQTERAKQSEGLIAAKDWADFEKRRGVIHGLDHAISMCQAADAKLRA